MESASSSETETETEISSSGTWPFETKTTPSETKTTPSETETFQIRDQDRDRDSIFFTGDIGIYQRPSAFSCIFFFPFRSRKSSLEWDRDHWTSRQDRDLWETRPRPIKSGLETSITGIQSSYADVNLASFCQSFLMQGFLLLVLNPLRTTGIGKNEWDINF